MIALASDHAGFELKETIKQYLKNQNTPVHDFGTNSIESCDYARFGFLAASAVARGECESAILCCGTGVGISLAANKVKGIRAVVCSEPFTAALSRAHNNANVLALGGRIVGAGLAIEIVRTFLSTAFEGGRHERRVGQITKIENGEIDFL